MIRHWISGLVRRRGVRLGATAGGIAVAVALLVSLGSFLAAAQGSMTGRAARGVAVDWQVEVRAGANPASVRDLVRNGPGVLRSDTVGFARTTGMSASGGGTAQTTGPGVVLGLPGSYRGDFPGAVRTLAGADHGVALAQQTAANLHAKPGDVIQLGRAGLPPVSVRVTEVVDLPQADSLFQKVGAPAGAQPSAPPDNVLILGSGAWHALFDPLAAARPDLVTTQIHAALNRSLPADPATAYTQVVGAAHNVEARSAGTAVVGNNLGAALDAARSDAAYARVLFLFLGLPGAVLAGLLTAVAVAAGAPRRRREQALLRARGATGRQLLRLAAAEALLVGAAGSVVGAAAAALIGLTAFGSARFGASGADATGWSVAAVLSGLAIAGLTVLAPAWRDLRGTTVASGRAALTRRERPAWSRYGLDVLLLAAAAVVFWLTSRTGYQLVLAPEGVPAISVSYWAFASPALFWLGSGLLAWRLAELLLGPGRRLLGRGLRPFAGSLANVVAGSLARQRRLLAHAIVLLALALSFAASTATFNATYQAQAEADAQLTNGADVTVTESPGTSAGPSAAGPIAATPGVRGVEPVQHRFAYVGADLQDLYGVRPDSITTVTALQDAYFQGGTARELMQRLAAQPDAILVSAETVKDFQLSPGDLLNLRLQDGRTKQFTTVAFHYAGVVKEFPTAPKDSFFVANAAYVAQHTGSDAVGAFLVDTGGQNTTAVARRLQDRLGPAATVTDIAHTRATVGSSLTAVDLAGLTRVELGFALVLAAAAGGLVLALGLAERRRSFAIAGALGATPRQLRSFVLGEVLVLGAGGLLAGGLAGWALSHLLVKVLTGVFDPPPAALTVPWSYLVAVGATAVAALAVVAAVTVRIARRSPIAVLHEL
ncbi:MULTISPECIES: FtsX-like permease family protein [Amycolatopsis]|uniref:ABC transport system permease protein n=1 Tax=Amycolatopsis echigonensis TaxID=2576905 RepID=A0A2N3WL50_9PSEU|nr:MULTISPECIES: FtsX-like permease family protein [Amycolatopsis]MBB2499946.1 FtsX-like permease family protein [Amycolatopsis echigonensis]MCG3751136.1 FtsX-like permease family protein [Amycolatopsis sp. Poz14]PKV94598.1 putative ABC transport system permease protein [Amycolatopsis niigatensis]